MNNTNISSVKHSLEYYNLHFDLMIVFKIKTDHNTPVYAFLRYFSILFIILHTYI